MTEQVAEKSLAPGDHGTTYGGNPLVGAAVSTVLDIYGEYIYIGTKVAIYNSVKNLERKM